MADVLLVYVQEDRAYAEGIGASLERSGLTVADGDGSMHTGADALSVLVLWSAHSTRSAIVRDLAIRAQREGKLITAKLAGCEAPLGFARPAPHDLSQWMGDPDDPLLDPLFFAADRLVCAVRLNARPDPLRAEPRLPPQQPIYPQGGHIHAPNNVRPLRAGPIASVGPSAARAARVEPDSAAMPQRVEPALPPNVAQEAAAWKRIEHSTDPKDYLDYLTTFSPNGMFCELAQLKLDKLTPKPKAAFIPHNPSPHVGKPRAAEGTRERRNAARTPPPAEMRPEPRPEPEPPRYAPRPAPRPDPRDEHRHDPHYDARPDPRYEPRPEPRPDPRPDPRYEPRPEPRYEPRPEARYQEPVEPRYEPRPRPRPESREDYEFESGPLVAPARSATNRPRRRAPAPQQAHMETRESGGMPWRPIIVVALLAAGGYAFFQTLPKQAAQSEASAPGQDLAEASRAAPLDELSAPAEVAPPAVGSGNAGLGAFAPAPRAQAARPAPAPQQRQQSAVVSAPPQQPAQNPIISFLPPQLQPAPQPAPAPVEPAPQPAPAAVQPAPAPAQPAAVVSATPGPASASGYVRPTWQRRPGAAQLQSAYPRRAADAGIAGQAQLDCLIQGDGALACSPTSSSPSNYGFAEAGLAVARYFRASPTLPDGSSAYGKRTTLTIRFASAN